MLERDGVSYVTYLKKSLPPLEFEYSKATHPGRRSASSTPASLENLPVGLDGATYQWVDLDGEGVSGILTEQAGAWFYKPNLGEGRFGPLQTVAAKPSLAAPEQRPPAAARPRRRRPARPGRASPARRRASTSARTDEGWEPFRAVRSAAQHRTGTTRTCGSST